MALKVRVFAGFVASSPAEQIPAYPDSAETATQTYILIYGGVYFEVVDRSLEKPARGRGFNGISNYIGYDY